MRPAWRKPCFSVASRLREQQRRRPNGFDGGSSERRRYRSEIKPVPDIPQAIVPSEFGKTS